MPEIEIVRPSACVALYGRAALTPGDDHAARYAAKLKPPRPVVHFEGTFVPRNKAGEEVWQRCSGPSWPSNTVLVATWDWAADPEPLPGPQELTRSEANAEWDRFERRMGVRVKWGADLPDLWFQLRRISWLPEEQRPTRFALQRAYEVLDVAGAWEWLPLSVMLVEKDIRIVWAAERRYAKLFVNEIGYSLVTLEERGTKHKKGSFGMYSIEYEGDLVEQTEEIRQFLAVVWREW